MESRKSFFWKNIELNLSIDIYIYTRTYESNQDKVSILNQDKEYWRQMEIVRYRIIKKKNEKKKGNNFEIKYVKTC